MGRMLLLYFALAAAVSWATGNYWIIAVSLFFALGVVLLVIPAINKRYDKQFMEDLRKMNRGRMDLPSGWTKKSWQHDEGECKRQKDIIAAQIEAHSAKSKAERKNQVDQ